MSMSKEEMREFMGQFASELKSDIVAAVNENINSKFEILTAENVVLKSKVSELEKQIEYNERELKRKNLVFHGIVCEGLQYFELENTILRIINEQLNVQCYEDEIDFIKRIKSNNTNYVVTIGLTTWRKKLLILQNKRNLNNSPIYLTEDLPKKVREERKSLIPIMNDAREQGKHAILKYNKLLIDGKVFEGESHSNVNMLESASQNTYLNKKAVSPRLVALSNNKRGPIDELPRVIKKAQKNTGARNREPNKLKNWLRPRAHSLNGGELSELNLNQENISNQRTPLLANTTNQPKI